MLAQMMQCFNTEQNNVGGNVGYSGEKYILHFLDWDAWGSLV